ncbi:hypothetical protein QCN27_03120 [Cereibacter sp. SYSU M97828]|nr:hypothetical protein [Cereibacter flavus]
MMFVPYDPGTALLLSQDHEQEPPLAFSVGILGLAVTLLLLLGTGVIG